MPTDKAVPLLLGATATTDGKSRALAYTSKSTATEKSLQCSLTGSGAISATLSLDVSNDGTNWIVPGLAAITLTGTDSVQEGTLLDIPWAFVKASLTAISGTNASASVFIGL